ncbi:MAG TPA: tetratricopeptide repeat protein [bacterium]|nr:tetratricopeptide repeat protein [bacterium]
MYFIILNLLLGLFFLFLIAIGIILQYRSYIPINVIGALIVLGTLYLDRNQNLSPGNILLLLLALVIVFITDIIFVYRDFREEITEVEARKRKKYLVEGIAPEHFKLIKDTTLIKNEITRNKKATLPDRVQAFELLKLGNEEFSKKKYREALEKYDLSTDLVQTAIGYLNQSGVLLKLGQFEDALVLAQRAQEIQSTFYEAILNQGIALEKQKQLEAALEKYRSAANINPDEFEIWFCAAQLLFKLERYKEAIEYYDKSLGLYGQQFEAWYYRGIALQKLDREVEALRSFEQAIKLNSYHAKLFFRVANILCRLNRDDEAIQAYQKSIKINADSAETWNNLGVTLNKIGRIKDAIKCYERAIKINERYFEAWLNKALALDTLGQPKKAYLSYQKFLDVAPKRLEKRIELTRKRLHEIKSKYKIKNQKSEKPAKKATKSTGESSNKNVDQQTANKNIDK